MVQAGKGATMKLLGWFKTKSRLLKEKDELEKVITEAKSIIDGLNAALQFNVNQLDMLRREAYVILGATTLQHNGELKIKNEFTNMMTSPDFNLTMQVERQADGLIFRIIETPAEKNE